MGNICDGYRLVKHKFKFGQGKRRFIVTYKGYEGLAWVISSYTLFEIKNFGINYRKKIDEFFIEGLYNEYTPTKLIKLFTENNNLMG